MKNKIKQILTSAILVTIIFSCCSRTRNIHDQDIEQALNKAIDIAVLQFEDPDYRISPNFHSELTHSIVYASFDSAMDLNYDSTELRKFSQQCFALEGVQISQWVKDKAKLKRISEDFQDLLIVVSSPMVDDKNSRIFFYVQTYYPDFDYNIKTLASFIGFELKTEKVSGGLELGSISAFTNFQPIFPSSKDSVPILPPAGVSITKIQMNPDPDNASQLDQ